MDSSTIVASSRILLIDSARLRSRRCAAESRVLFLRSPALGSPSELLFPQDEELPERIVLVEGDRVHRVWQRRHGVDYYVAEGDCSVLEGDRGSGYVSRDSGSRTKGP